MRALLVTGSSGLIGSEVCSYFAHELGCRVHGLDNNQRAVFFGPAGDTRWNQQRLQAELPGFVHHELDIRDRAGVMELIKEIRPAIIVHTAAQPSHDRAAAIPFDDFDTNAVGTLNMLEAARQFCPEAHYPSTQSSEETGAKRGCVVLGSREIHGNLLCALLLLRQHCKGAHIATNEVLR